MAKKFSFLLRSLMGQGIALQYSMPGGTGTPTQQSNPEQQSASKFSAHVCPSIEHMPAVVPLAPVDVEPPASPEDELVSGGEPLVVVAMSIPVDAPLPDWVIVSVVSVVVDELLPDIDPTVVLALSLSVAVAVIVFDAEAVSESLPVLEVSSAHPANSIKTPM